MLSFFYKINRVLAVCVKTNGSNRVLFVTSCTPNCLCRVCAKPQACLSSQAQFRFLTLCHRLVAKSACVCIGVRTRTYTLGVMGCVANGLRFARRRARMQEFPSFGARENITYQIKTRDNPVWGALETRYQNIRVRVKMNSRPPKAHYKDETNDIRPAMRMKFEWILLLSLVTLQRPVFAILMKCFFSDCCLNIFSLY